MIEFKNILPNKSYTKEDIIIENKEDNILIYYITKYLTGKLKTDKFQPAKALIPKFIEISNELIECMGMYQGDGQKSIKSKSYQSTRFTNSEPELLKLFLKFMNKFNIKNEDLRFNLIISKNINYDEDFLKRYWSKELNIHPEQFYKIQWRDNKYKNSIVQPYGTLTIIYSNSSFRLVLDSLLKYIKERALKEKVIAASFIKGLMAADGHVTVAEFRKQVNIAAKEPEDREFIVKLFKLLGMNNITNYEGRGAECVKIGNYHNFLICKKYDLCEIHPKKKNRFNDTIKHYDDMIKITKKSKTYFRNHKNYMQPIYNSKILELLKEKPKTISELSSNFEITKNALRRYTEILEKKGKIKRINDYLTRPANRSYKTGRTEELYQLTNEPILYTNTPKQIILNEIQKLQPIYLNKLRTNLNFHYNTLKQALSELEKEGKIILRKQTGEEKKNIFQ